MSALKKFKAERSATYVRDGIVAVRMLPTETNPHPLPATFTPLEQQVVDLRMSLPSNMILVIMCGYKMKCFGRDARVVSRRLGFMCMHPSNTPFEYCSFPVQRTILHCSRLVAMGYHVGIVDQIESAAGRAVGGGGGSKVFERKLTRALSKGSAPDFSTLSIGGGGGAPSGGQADDDDDNGDDEDNEGASAAVDPTSSSNTKGAADDSNFILFIAETATSTEFTYVSIGSRMMAHHCVSLDGGNGADANDAINNSNINDIGGAVSPSIKYQESVIAALQSGLLCYAPVEIVVSSTLTMTQQPASASPSSPSSALSDQQQKSLLLSKPLASVINALCAYHFGPADGSNGSDGNVLVTLYDGTLKASYERAVKEMMATGPSSPLPTADVTSDASEASATAPSPTLKAMMATYFAFFQATDALGAVSMAPFLYRKDGSMNLPPTSLQALDLFPASSKGTIGANDSLFTFINRSMTSCGARRLRAWLAAPMCDLSLIKARQAAVAEIAGEVVDRKLLRAFLQQGQGADIEGAMTRLCSGRCSYNEYKTFLEKIAALRAKAEALVMDYTTQLEEKGVGVDASTVMEQILSDFINDDVKAALEEESLYLKYGRDVGLEDVYLRGLPRPLPDALQTERDVIKGAEATLDEELAMARRVLGLPNLQYKTVALVTNLIEVPTAAEGKVPKEWAVVSRIKSATRYRTDVIVRQCAVRTAAEERLAAAAKAHFVEHQTKRYGAMSKERERIASGAADGSSPQGGGVNLYTAFNNFINAVATIDALQSLAVLAKTPGYCLPTLVPQSTASVLRDCDDDTAASATTLLLKGLAHPMARAKHADYVTCDVAMDGRTRGWLLTGPNMGGKSALMRSVALCAVLGQVGAHVPATEAILPIFTSIWCRMGAQDDLLEGTSTFMLEMKETRDIVTSPDLTTSLVLMDELGRGTSSYDGVAVADATLGHMLKARCVCMFVTHYHLLTDWHRGDPTLRLKYMSYAEEEADVVQVKAEEGSDAAAAHRRRRIIFLYQPVDGVTPSSFGINVSAMAGLPECVLAVADAKSKEAEERHSATRALHTVRSLLKL